MAWIITDPRGVTGALADPRPGLEALVGRARPERLPRLTEPEPACRRWIADVPPLGPADRLDIYAHAYLARLVETLAADYPVLARLLGDEPFRDLVADYLVAYPSRYATVGEVGRHLPEFLSSHALASRSPSAPDLARLEWAVTESFLADDVAEFDPASVRDLGEEDWERARFVLDPSMKLVAVAYPVDALWSSAQAGESLSVETVPAPGHLLIRRRDFTVFVERIEPLAHALLDLMRAGLSLGELAEEIPARFGPLAGEAGVLSEFGSRFGDWVACGIVRGVRLAN